MRGSSLRTLLAAVALLWPASAGALVMRVTNADDRGPGTLRAAVEAANANRAVTAIWFSQRGLAIELASGIEYTGAQTLHIEALGATLRSAPGGAFPLLASSGGASLLLRSLTLRGSGAQGLRVTLPASATRMPWLRLIAVSASQNAGCAIEIDDPSGSSAGVGLLLVRGAFISNGAGLCLEELGAGSVWATIQLAQFSGNAGDGLELREAGPGAVVLTLSGSRFSANGLVDPQQPGSGLDVDELDAGELRAVVSASSFDGNGEHGLALDEAGDGWAHTQLVRLTARNNLGDGVAIAEGDAGYLTSNLLVAHATGNGGEGAVLEELGAGNLRGLIASSQLTGNAANGIGAAQEAPGTGNLLVSRSGVSGNGGEQLEIEGVSLSLR